MMNKKIIFKTSAQAASDGDGVQLKRVIGTQQLNYLDPFLLLDEFGSDKPLDYIGGFPDHPHRGFETVTYMLAGKMRHKDSAGHSGVIETGDVQWMTAGRGIIHSEMPEQTQGMLAGLQLWVNLPAQYKMTEPKYQEYSAEQIPEETRDNNVRLKVIAGQTQNGTKGVINNNFVNPSYWHVFLPASQDFTEVVNPKHNSFVYVLKGEIEIDPESPTVKKGELVVLSQGENLTVTAKNDSEFVYIDGKPLNEPVARGGPFVMNTREEILKAFHDFQSGKFV
ncbi:MAG TPA: pirin family protein [Gammaproteobacteria bacterium]|nr:pirin family protein [Gammaproteobacteria bacterium]